MKKPTTLPPILRSKALHRSGVGFRKGAWRCHHGTPISQRCGDCTWEDGYYYGYKDGQSHYTIEKEIKTLGNVEYSMVIESRSEDEAITHASKIPLEDWPEAAKSDITAEEE